MKHLLVLFCLCFASSIIGQLKYEKEYRIGQEQVPEDALQFVTKLKVTSKVKWFREESNEGYSVEAKFKLKKELYSVEFDTTGALQDIEITLSTSDYPALINHEITDQLNQLFTSFKIDKVQEQFSGNEEDVLNFLISNSSADAITKRYEIVISTLIEKEWKQFELTFSTSGELIKRLEVSQINTDHLEY